MLGKSSVKDTTGRLLLHPKIPNSEAEAVEL